MWDNPEWAGQVLRRGTAPLRRLIPETLPHPLQQYLAPNDPRGTQDVARTSAETPSRTPTPAQAAPSTPADRRRRGGGSSRQRFGGGGAASTKGRKPASARSASDTAIGRNTWIVVPTPGTVVTPRPPACAATIP